MNEPRLAILFWFYSDADLCVNRLQLLRRWNPDLPVYGLFGGRRSEEGTFERALASHLDDFWAFPQERDARWKWRHGDLLIADWFVERGAGLEWDSIVVAQWDTLFLGAVRDLLPDLGRDDLFLAGLRPVREVEGWWQWVRGRHRDDYRRFLAHVRERHGYDGEPLCCLFVVACLPRSFLERYAAVEERELGFLEYRLPIYAQVFGTRFAVDAGRLGPWWASDPAASGAPQHERVLNAAPEMVDRETILRELRRPGGARVFHPHREPFPLDVEPDA